MSAPTKLSRKILRKGMNTVISEKDILTGTLLAWHVPCRLVWTSNRPVTSQTSHEERFFELTFARCSWIMQETDEQLSAK